MDASKETLPLGATSSDQSILSSQTISSSKPLTISKKTTINAFLTSRRKFFPDHAADVGIFFKAIRTYENERAARKQKTAPTNRRPGKCIRKGKELAQRFSTPPVVIFKNPALQARKGVTSKPRIEVDSPEGQYR